MKNSRRPLIIVSMALLLVVVLAMGGVTFAKYISTTGVRSNQANVAKWGFTMSVDATNMFNNNYAAASDKLSVVAEDGTAIVSFTADTNIIAPGSKGSMTFSIGGTAEVLSKLTVDSDCADIVLYEDGDPVYHPIKWTLTRDGAVVNALENVTIAEVEAYIESMDREIDANTRYELDGTYVLSWKWDWSVDAETDAKDTALGMFYANKMYQDAATGVGQPLVQGQNIIEGQDPVNAGTTCTVSFQMKITIEQIQTKTVVNP